MLELGASEVGFDGFGVDLAVASWGISEDHDLWSIIIIMKPNLFLNILHPFYDMIILTVPGREERERGVV